MCPITTIKRSQNAKAGTCITIIQMHIPFTTIPTNQVITLIGLSMESTLYLDCPGANTGSAVIRTLISYILITERLTTQTTSNVHRSFPVCKKNVGLGPGIMREMDQIGTNQMTELLTH